MTQPADKLLNAIDEIIDVEFGDQIPTVILASGTDAVEMVSVTQPFYDEEGHKIAVIDVPINRIFKSLRYGFSKSSGVLVIVNPDSIKTQKSDVMIIITAKVNNFVSRDKADSEEGGLLSYMQQAQADYGIHELLDRSESIQIIGARWA